MGAKSCPEKQKNICGKRIRELRKNAGGSGGSLTQDQLVAKLQLKGYNISRSVLSKIENEKRAVSEIEVTLIAKVLGVDANCVIGFDDEETQQKLCDLLSESAQGMWEEDDADLQEDGFLAAED